MRKTFAQTLVELAERDPRVVLLTADLGFTVLEPFMERFPTRFFNMGVAEQNMVGTATGLAESGFLPFVYSIVTFASLRAFEFIRNGPVLHHLPVRIVSVGGGVEYATAGPTHYGVEDVGIMRTQPDLTIVVPADPQQARAALLATWNVPGPVYYRMSKDDTAHVPGLDGRFRPGRVELIGNGSDVLFIAMGPVAAEAVAAAERLCERGVGATVAVAASITPAPVGDLVALLSRFRAVLTVEAHYVTGGLGSLVCEVAAEHGLPCRVTRCGIRSMPSGMIGSQEYLHQTYGLSADALVQAAMNATRVEQRVGL